MKNVSVKSKAIPTLGDNLGNTFLIIGLKKEFMTKSSKAILTKTKIVN